MGQWFQGKVPLCPFPSFHDSQKVGIPSANTTNCFGSPFASFHPLQKAVLYPRQNNQLPWIPISPLSSFTEGSYTPGKYHQLPRTPFPTTNTINWLGSAFPLLGKDQKGFANAVRIDKKEMGISNFGNLTNIEKSGSFSIDILERKNPRSGGPPYDGGGGGVVGRSPFPFLRVSLPHFLGCPMIQKWVSN